ncbi:MAG: hypothetical protein JXB25_07885 [Deltaproteobacteria bacterium]|nr:hypothetical protein [Deltaproteobacteria bacterium]
MMNLRNELKKQLSFIETSCALYDKGNIYEALRIAVALRVIFHDTKKSTSILTQLDIKGKIRLITTIGSQMTHEELAEIKASQNLFLMSHIPLMLTPLGVKPLLENHDSSEVTVAEKWWNELVLINQTAFSRKDIVLVAANEDGGAHVEPKPSAKTKNLKASQGKFIIKRGFQQVSKELIEHHLPIIRQIGYEVLHSKMLLQVVADT